MGPWWIELSDDELYSRLWYRVGDDNLDNVPWIMALVKNREDEKVVKEINIILKEPDGT